MKILLLSFTLIFSVRAFAFKFPKVCQNLLQAGCSEESRADYRLNFKAFGACLETLEESTTSDPSCHHKLTVKNIDTVDGYPFYRIELKPKSGEPRHRILLTSGIHGDEAIGPAALINYLEESLQGEPSQENYYLVYPMLNPWGNKHCTRRNKLRVDMNRELKPSSEFSLFRILVKDLEGKKFDLGIDMHEAGSHEFFFLGNNKKDISYGVKALANFPLDLLVQSPDGRYPFQKENKPYTFYAPGAGMSTNKGTMKAFMKDYLKIPVALTTEAPLALDLFKRKSYYKKFVEDLVANLVKA